VKGSIVNNKFKTILNEEVVAQLQAFHLEGLRKTIKPSVRIGRLRGDI
jgi:hypothetical protein